MMDKNFWGRIFFLSGMVLGLSACRPESFKVYERQFWERIEAKSARMNQLEVVALNLAKENRQLKNQISQLKFDIKKLETEKNFLEMQNAMLVQGKKKRAPASIVAKKFAKDLVRYDIYRWTPTQMISIADAEFKKKNYEKAAQFYHTLYSHFPNHDSIDDQFLFKAGLATYESGEHYDQSFHYLSQLVRKYNSSPYFRGAKLWISLLYLRLDKREMFFNAVEEFRKKYRNTPEWKVLSQHYEAIIQKYKDR